LHWSFSFKKRATGVTRYATLWCPDFPLSQRIGIAIRRSAGAKIALIVWKKLLSDF
jgi:hypothetical protein